MCALEQVSHPDFAIKTKLYLREKKMEHNVHLWMLQFLSKSMAESLMARYESCTIDKCQLT
jgi:hypothetical protein